MNGKTVLITGASSGFGKLAVKRLLARGHRVIAGVRGGQARLERIFAEELLASPGRLFAADLHMDDPATFAEAEKLVEREFGGRLDALVNNAGFMLLGPFETQSKEDIEFQMSVNFFGPVELTRRLLPALKRAQGRILNISSAAGVVSIPYYATYCGSKHALEAHTEGLYYDLKSQGVQVGLIEPGSFHTDIVSASARGAGARDPQSRYFTPLQNLEKMMAENMHLAGNPDRVARLIVRRVEQRRIPIRSLIGFDAWIFVTLKRLLPERVRVPLIEWVFRTFIARSAPEAGREACRTEIPAPAHGRSQAPEI